MGAGALLILPWYFSAWTPAIHGVVAEARWWLLPQAVPLVAALALYALRPESRLDSHLLWLGVVGMALLLLQGFSIDHRSGTWPFTTAKQAGMGVGAAALALTYLMFIAIGLAARGWCRGDLFAVGALLICGALVALFVFWPVGVVLERALRGGDGHWSATALATRLTDETIWSLSCLAGGNRCGIAWNSLFLAVLTGAGTTLVGLAFALIAVRAKVKFSGPMRVVTLLPIITPPFVVGLAIILLFGRNGVLSVPLSEWFDVPRSRWIYGWHGVLIAQILAFAPIAFLVLVGVVEGISPALEEAAQTLRASAWTTFRTVTWPLLRPGLANAFLLGFVESLADFGNPLVLGGSFDVLATRIFFAVVGAAQDESRAAALAVVLLALTLAAFWAQARWLAGRSYVTVAGKGDGGLPLPLPKRVSFAAWAVAGPWALFTVAVYLTILVGGLVEAVGRDWTPTLAHYNAAFGLRDTGDGLRFSGAAWSSFWTTVLVAVVAAPLTAAIGVVTAWLLARQTFVGRSTFEFGMLLSFAIPGTVIGISYILAFNVPPVEITGTAMILIVCFVFRNMPVGVRAGLASLSQIDKSLDEASMTLGAGSATTLRRVILPLVRPAVLAALVYSFVRAMTALSAVIFLVTAKWNMATAYIVGRVDAGELGIAIAYSTVLIVVMLAAIGGIQFLVGRRQLGRRGAQTLALGGS